MKTIIRRIERLEKRLKPFIPAPKTAVSQELIERTEEELRRVKERQEPDGLSEPSDAQLVQPPEDPQKEIPSEPVRFSKFGDRGGWMR